MKRENILPSFKNDLHAFNQAQSGRADRYSFIVDALVLVNFNKAVVDHEITGHRLNILVLSDKYPWSPFRVMSELVGIFHTLILALFVAAGLDISKSSRGLGDTAGREAAADNSSPTAFRKGCWPDGALGGHYRFIVGKTSASRRTLRPK